ncbi:cyclin-dependent kinase inhibitor 3 family protein [Skermanella sp. TT6]|uniref:Cyclin-dependent kinase inhibitor 3 family protein n=1 Tax=Skermanella cutis TaxID=2775420 RepID=A0ABX7B670_9PROT|nr:cyclin-dependent kinase inhibitor 3 family protein [Skermanella sp. TT6]QQP89841.1 cyclin-dependent kinase inhibitor 3 family protein [Skermanella sp. TT6]
MLFIENSANRPLQICTVSCGRGRIGIVPCPGRKQPRPGSGTPCERDTRADVEVLARWGAKALLSLMEAAELRRYGAADIGRHARAAGIGWHHLPISDLHPPDERFEQAWSTIGPSIRSLLAAGDAVAIHCLAGRGRSGTVAGRLLIEMGTDPGQALGLLRSLRPGAVSTAAQAAYLTNRTWLAS